MLQLNITPLRQNECHMEIIQLCKDTPILTHHSLMMHVQGHLLSLSYSLKANASLKHRHQNTAGERMCPSPAKRDILKFLHCTYNIKSKNTYQSRRAHASYVQTSNSQLTWANRCQFREGLTRKVEAPAPSAPSTESFLLNFVVLTW